VQNYPAASNYAEELTGISGSGVGVSGGALYFVNPWITDTILDSVADTNDTQLYFYVNVINTGQTAYTPTSGSIDLTWYSADHLDGVLIGVFYKGKFTSAASALSSGLSITPTTSYYAIYEITTTKLNNDPSGLPSSDNLSSVMFWGDASITDWGQSSPSAESYGYFSATVLIPGLWIRAGC
jgi:hypothetical protein